jgi:apoptosis-inducing factor 3
MSTQRRATYQAVCQADTLHKGEMQQFSVSIGNNIKEVLLLRAHDGSVQALAAHCSHYGAPLVKGVLHQDRVICPWHHACFSATSGKQLEPPGCNDLVQYPVSIESGTVYVELSDSKQEHLVPRILAPSASSAPIEGLKGPNSSPLTFVIVGAGAAGAAAAEKLRQIGFQGRIVMLSAESELPYDRTKLSKAFLQSDEIKSVDVLRSPQFYKQYDIDIKTNAKVTQLNVKSQQLTYGNGSTLNTLNYDALLLATGGKVTQLPIKGNDLKNVFTLRRIEEAQEILKAAKSAQRAVIVGTGFIGMEVAASLSKQGLNVTVVAPNKVPFEKVLGADIGRIIQQKHESHGVIFKLGSQVIALQGNHKVESVELDTGEILPADMVVAGIGVKPATDFMKQIALDKNDNSVPVDQHLQAAPGIYAAGDIAQFPHFITGKPVRIEHWRLAMQHGQTAACNMLGQNIPFTSVPFFWTEQFDIKLRYVGHAEQWDNIVIQGNLDKPPFLAFYGKANQVMAVAGVGCDRDLAAIEELMRLGQMPAMKDIKQNAMDWISWLA